MRNRVRQQQQQPPCYRGFGRTLHIMQDAARNHHGHHRYRAITCSPLPCPGNNMFPPPLPRHNYVCLYSRTFPALPARSLHLHCSRHLVLLTLLLVLY